MTTTTDKAVMPETVKLHVIISIEVDEEADTGLTVDEWNGLNDKSRQAIVDDFWQSAAEADNGGVGVVTAGAVGV